MTQELCAVTLDYALLHDLGLLRDASSISRMEVRARTRLMCAKSLVSPIKQTESILRTSATDKQRSTFSANNRKATLNSSSSSVAAWDPLTMCRSQLTRGIEHPLFIPVTKQLIV